MAFIHFAVYVVGLHKMQISNVKTEHRREQKSEIIIKNKMKHFHWNKICESHLKLKLNNIQLAILEYLNMKMNHLLHSICLIPIMMDTSIKTDALVGTFLENKPMIFSEYIIKNANDFVFANLIRAENRSKDCIGNNHKE